MCAWGVVCGAGCKKGNRECKYPPPTNKSGGNRQGQRDSEARKNSTGSLSSDDNEASQRGGLEAIPDGNEEEDEEEGTQSSIPHYTGISKSANPRISTHRNAREKEKHISRKSSDSSLMGKAQQDRQPTDIQARSASQASSKTSSSASQSSPLSPHISKLPEDIRFYLRYHQENLNYHHYFMRFESAEFVHTTILDQALAYEPLLYAIVGFAAWHHALKQAEGRLNDFLKYYHRSLTLLRESLASKEKRGEGMLLTTLQLATFEVCIPHAAK
jgi:hypothetical protein